MADDNDKSQKTEEPTQRRLEEAHRRGEFATSREISTWFMLLGGALVVILLVPAIGRDLSGLLLAFFERPQEIQLDRDGLQQLGAAILSHAGIALVLPMLIMVVCALAGGLVQSGFRIAPDRIMPKFERISPKSGAGRLFSHRSLVEFLKGLVKLAIVGAVVTVLMMPELSRMESMTSLESVDVLRVMMRLGARLMIGVLAIVTLIAVLDYLYQRVTFLRGMRMSRQEIRDELKQTEGDPQVRARLRQIRQERARKRMMAAVPDATVVVTNPTHFAVALKYELETMAAPVLIAKGADLVARRIREVAEEAKVPIVESKPLAQALYAGVEIGQEVPPQYYKAVAEIVGYVFRLQGKLKGVPVRPSAG
jgi:flagellar biosynthetic protein FlhB